MAPHLKRRGSRWYIVDGSLRRSLKTDKRGVAEFLFRQHLEGKYGLRPTPTVKEFYELWIKTKTEPLFRRALIRDYKQQFNAYILPRFGDVRLLALGTGELVDFRAELLRRRLSVKTVRNIIDGSFRAMYRDARAQTEALKGRDPFLDLQWPRGMRQRPDPFTAEERGRILAFFREHEPYYYPLVFFQFETGARPAETAALFVSDVNVETGEISISKSRHLGADNRPKTGKSHRVICVPVEVIEVLLTLPSFEMGLERLFLNKQLGPLNINQWAVDYWPRVLKALGIRHRKFYATRHTFITEQVKRGELLKAIADYCGTSVTMIEENYCGTLGLSDRTVLAQSVSKRAEYLASPTGFEPVLPA